ncbi:MAG: hypothetical protein KME25_03160 [Symplocastrum torsivum CPER-KK1]|uniref:Oligosaccharide repeat unit polymerase n=1 Tax=Symplocastrum torsivum CPER-KK1 TaxID=450513 RepID=A0A951PH42_9CYAN|nr:hypothetical protein [Symplocastrum torsivum CPER-KK1]
MAILLLFYCLLFLISIVYLYLKLKRDAWSIDVFFLSIIVVFYIFIPINIIVFGHEIYEPAIKSYLSPASRFVSLQSFFITLIFLVSFFVGEAFKGSVLKPINVHVRKLNRVILYKAVSYFLSLFCFVSLLIYIQQFGGFSSFAVNLIINRSGQLDQALVGSYAFFGKFIDLAIIPLIYFLYKKRKTKISFILLCCLPLFVMLFSNLFISVSKLKFIALGLLFYFTLSLRCKRLYISYLLLFFAFVFIALPVLDELFIFAYRVFQDEGLLAVPLRIFSAIGSGSLGQGQYEAFLKENVANPYLQGINYFTFVQMSLQLSIDNSYPLLFFRDFYTGIVDILPSRLNIQTGIQVNQLNTALYYENYPNLPELSESFVPPGIIGFAMYSLSVPGVFIVGFGLGYVFRKVDFFFKSLLEFDLSFAAFYAYAIFVLAVYPINGLPRLVLYDFVNLVFLFIFFVLSFKFEAMKAENIRN